MPCDHCIDGGDDCFSLAALVPRQISALVEPFDRVVIKHAGEQGADDGPRLPRVKLIRQCLAGISKQSWLALDHIDKFVLTGVRVMQCGHGTR